jgi:PAS domain S-box-containing protein
MMLSQADQAVLDALPVGVTVFAADGTIVRRNRRALELMGVNALRGEPAGGVSIARALFTLDGRPIAPRDTPAALALADGRAREGVELVVENPDGRRWIVSTSVEPLLDNEGVILGAVCCFHDVTVRHRREREAVAACAHFEAVFENAPEAILVVSRDGGLLQMNAAALALAGVESFDAVKDQPVLELVALEDRQRWKACNDWVCDGERLAWDFEMTGPEGVRRRVAINAAPLTLGSGETVQLGCARDIGEAKRQQAAVVESERRSREMLEAFPAAIYTTDAEGRITFFNEAAAEFAGRRPVLGSDLWCVSWKLYRADGSPLPREESPMAYAVKERRPTHGLVEMIAERPDGVRIPFIPYATPLFDSERRFVGVVAMLVDISERKRAEESQKALIAELNHRVKNTLATVQSVAMQTAREAESLACFRDAFDGRLIALAKAHDLLTRNSWRGASLGDLLAHELAPYPASAISLDGPPVELGAPAALTFGMMFHELATNAAKHGAFSAPEGRVSVRWSSASGERLEFEWREEEGPQVVAPERRGFGLRLLENAAQRDLGGRTELDFAPEGLRCRIFASLGGPSPRPG